MAGRAFFFSCPECIKGAKKGMEKKAARALREGFIGLDPNDSRDTNALLISFGLCRIEEQASLSC
jgi:hypothetical protein